MTYVDCKALVIVPVLTSYTTVIQKSAGRLNYFHNVKWSIFSHSVNKQLLIAACMR